MELQKLANAIDVANEIEAYTYEYLFDPTGLLLSGIDTHTNEPFKRAAVTPQRVPRRARHDPWSYWTYEDTIMASGFLIEGMVLKYLVTGDEKAIDEARRVWQRVRMVYYHSQVHGPGTFLRPYGGHDQMDRFTEPLGTDQAGPLFCGVYRLLPHLDPTARREASDIMVNTLRWYADQGYQYLYYKFMIHAWKPPLHHAATYYLPALLFAHRHDGGIRFARDFKHYLARQLSGGEYTLAYSFRFGSELLVLRDLMGSQFGQHFTADKIEQIWHENQKELVEFKLPEMWRRQHPESEQDGFAPYKRPDYRDDVGMGFELFGWVHGGRARPRHEVSVLCALAALGREDAAELAVELIGLRKQVPWDFTPWNFEDHDELPHAVQLYASTVGVGLINSWRDIWMLAAADQGVI